MNAVNFLSDETSHGADVNVLQKIIKIVFFLMDSISTFIILFSDKQNFSLSSNRKKG